MTYRPDIDGLRAVAVLAVVFYHYGVAALPGGFVGVDIFFVISGYLITGILRGRIEAGRLSVAEFYARRIRRIVPALLVVLLATLAVGYVLLMPGDYASLGGSAAYASVGAGNLYFFWHTGYFDRDADLLPLLHTWSLGVEEQFYLVWPLLLAAIIRIASGRERWVRAAIVLVMVASFAWGVRALAVDPKAAFYLPHLRAWELAVGAWLVFVRPIERRVMATVCGIAGIASIGWSLIAIQATNPFPGWAALVPVLGAAAVVWPKRSDPVTARLLALPPLRHVGLVSYSFYLWHWPVLVFFRHYVSGEMPTGREAVVLGLIAYGLSVLSWWYVERPFRRGTATQRIVLVSGAAANVAGVLRRECETIGERVATSFRTQQRPMYERLDRLAAEREDLMLVQPAYGLCDEATCVTTIDGEPLYRDGNHIRRNLSMPVRRQYAGWIGLSEALSGMIQRSQGR